MTSNCYNDGTYLARHPTWHSEDSQWKAEQIAKMLRRHDIQPRRVCEVGCGAGAVIDHLRSHIVSPCEFVGYDVSAQAIELCQSRRDANLSYVQADINGVGEGFDVVLCIDVFEHIEDCFGFLRSLRGKGTYKVFHIPLELSVERVVLNRFLESRRNFGHIHIFNRDTALELLRECGHEIIDSFYAPAAFAFPAHRLGAKLARVPRRVLSWISPALCSRFLGGWSLVALTK